MNIFTFKSKISALDENGYGLMEMNENKFLCRVMSEVDLETVRNNIDKILCVNCYVMADYRNEHFVILSAKVYNEKVDVNATGGRVENLKIFFNSKEELKVDAKNKEVYVRFRGVDASTPQEKQNIFCKATGDNARILNAKSNEDLYSRHLCLGGHFEHRVKLGSLRFIVDSLSIVSKAEKSNE